MKKQNASVSLLAACFSFAVMPLVAAPVITDEPDSITPALGSTAVLSAVVTAEPTASYTWSRNGVAIINGGRYAGATTASLSIAGVNSGDNGDYTLTVSDNSGSDSSVPASISVTQSAASLDSAYSAAGVSGNPTSFFTNHVLHLPDGRSLVATNGQFIPGTFSNLSLLSASTPITGTQPWGSFNGQVTSLFRQGDGKILLAGNFSTHTIAVFGVGNVNTTRIRVARLNADLSLDTSFAPTSSGASATPSVVFSDSFGRVYVGGAFASYNGNTDYKNLVRLKEDGSLDLAFKPFILGSVTHAVVQSDGKFIVAGIFSDYGPAGATTRAAGLIRFHADGSVDTSYQPVMPQPFVGVSALAIDANDRVYAAQGGVGVDLVRVLEDGSLDDSFIFEPELNGHIKAIAALSSGKIMIGGVFTSPPSNRLMRLNTNGSQDSTFDVGVGFNGNITNTFVSSITPDASGRLWLTGQGFSTYNTISAPAFAVLQGEAAPSLFFIAQPTGRVVDQGAASVSFRAAGSGTNGFSYRWHKNGVPLSDGGRVSGALTDTLTLTNLEESDEATYTAVLSSPGLPEVTSRAALLNVKGAPVFTSEPPATATAEFGGSVTLNATADGAGTLTYQWFKGSTALTNGPNISGATTNSLTLSNLALTDAGSYFVRVTGLTSFDSSATVLTVQKLANGIAPGTWPSFSSEVYDILTLPDGSFIVGGSFDRVTINGVETQRKKLVRILSTGVLDTNFPQVTDASGGEVRALARDDSGRIYIGGDFTSLGGSTRIRVARLTSAFALDSAFNTSVGPNKAVHSLAPVGDGSVYIGGSFDAIGAVTTGVRYMAKLTAAGARDAGFTSSVHPGAQDNNKTVYSILRLANGTLYAASNVTYWGYTSVLPGLQSARVVKLSASGARDFAFKFAIVAVNPESFHIGHKLIQLADGSILVGGNASPSAYLKRMNAATGAELPFPHTLNQIVFDLVQQKNGQIVIGGQFNRLIGLGSTNPNYLTRASPLGVFEPEFGSQTGFNGIVYALALDANGRIYVGGAFSSYNGQSRGRFIVLNGNDPKSQVLAITPPANPTFTPGQNVFTIPATSSSGLPVTLALTSGPATLVGNKLTITGAGNVVITGTQAGNASFDPAVPTPVTIVVPKQNQSILFSPIVDKPSGSAPFLLSAASSAGLPITYSVVSGPATVSGNVLSLTGTPGTVILSASQSGDANFLAAPSVQQSFDVFQGSATKLAQSIAFNPLPARSVSQGLTFDLNALASSRLPVTYSFTGPVASIVGSTVTLTGALGTVSITASQAGDANYLAATPVKQSFAVTAAVNAMTLTDLVQTYTGTPRAVSVIGVVGEPQVFYTIGGVKGSTKPTNVGSYPVEAVLGTGKTQVKKTGTLVINKAPLFVVADDKRKFVGQDNPLLTFAYSGFLDDDHAGNSVSKAPTVTSTASKTSPGGNYPITPAAGTSANYAFVYVKGNMEVETFAGQYEALLLAQGSPAPTAKLEFTVTANSVAFTGKLITAKELTPVALTGNLTLDFIQETATFSKAFTRGTGQNAVTYTVNFTLPLEGDFNASVTRGTGTPAANLTSLGTSTTGKRLLLLTGTQTVPYAGAHTVLLGAPVPLLPSPLPLPKGLGHATAVIDSKGKMTLAGKLPDGTGITATLLPDADTVYQLYLQPYAGRANSYLGGLLPLTSHPDQPTRGYIALAANRDLYWAKEGKSTDANYRGNIPESALRVSLDLWIPPLAARAPNPAITLPQRLGLNGTGDLNVSYDALTGLTTTGLPALVNMNAAGLINVPGAPPNNNPRAWKITVTPTTGAFTGSFTVLDGAISRLVNVSGVLRQPLQAETNPAVVGGGQGLLPQVTGQSAGTTLIGIGLTRP